MSQDAAIACQGLSAVFLFLCPPTPFLLDSETPCFLGRLIFFLVINGLFPQGCILGLTIDLHSPLGI